MNSLISVNPLSKAVVLRQQDNRLRTVAGAPQLDEIVAPLLDNPVHLRTSARHSSELT